MYVCVCEFIIHEYRDRLFQFLPRPPQPQLTNVGIIYRMVQKMTLTAVQLHILGTFQKNK